MSGTRIHGSLASLLVVPLAIAATIVRADVVIDQSVDIDGAAGFSMLAMQGKSTTSLTAMPRAPPAESWTHWSGSRLRAMAT